MAPDARTQAVELLARTLHDFAMIGAPWAALDDEVRALYCRRAVVQLDALLAARVPCPTCGGKGKVPGMVTWTEGVTTHGAGYGTVPCPDCDDGRGGPLVLLAGEQP